MGLLDDIFGAKKTSTSQQTGTSSTQSQAYNDPRFQDFWNNFSSVFSGASSAYTPINSYQTNAANQLAGAGNFIFPAYNNANDVATNGITTGDINKYMSPYTQNVVDATQAQFNNNNARTLAGQQASAAKQGALTGTQAQVGRAISEGQLAAAQNPVIAGLYQSGYNSAVDTAGKNAALRTQAAGAQGNLVNAYTNAGNAAYGAGQSQWEDAFKNTMTPFQLMTQGAGAWNPFLQGAGTTTNSSGTATGEQTSRDSLWNIGKGVAATGMALFPGFADGGSVDGGSKKPKEFHEKVTDAFKAITEMKRASGGGVLPRYDAGGGVNYDPTWSDTTVTPEPAKEAAWKSWAKDNQSIGYGPKDDGNMLAQQQSALSSFMSGLGRADGGFVRRGYDGGGGVRPGYDDRGFITDANDPALPNGSPPYAAAPEYRPFGRTEREALEDFRNDPANDVPTSSGSMPSYPGFSYREPAVGPTASVTPPVTTASTGATPRMPSRYAAPQVRDEMMYARGDNSMPQGGFWGTIFGNTPKNGVLDGRPMSKWDRLTYLVGNSSISTDGSGKAGITDALMGLEKNRREELDARNKAAKLLMDQHSHPYDIAHKVAQTNLANTSADKEFLLNLEKRKAEYAKELAIAQKRAEMDLLYENAERLGIDLRGGKQPNAASNGRYKWTPMVVEAPPPGAPNGYSANPPAANAAPPEVKPPTVAPPAEEPPKDRRGNPIWGNSAGAPHPNRAQASVGQYYRRPDGSVYKRSLLGEYADIPAR